VGVSDPLARDASVPQRLVISNEHGLTFPAGDGRALAESIDRLFQRPSLAAALGSAARRRVEQEFSLDQCVDAHLALFEDLIERQTRSSPPGPRGR
jgi:glycosyltransferase involved in cell wall biosynthesis